jgi:hypothetical protein
MRTLQIMISSLNFLPNMMRNYQIALSIVGRKNKEKSKKWNKSGGRKILGYGDSIHSNDLDWMVGVVKFDLIRFGICSKD